LRVQGWDIYYNAYGREKIFGWTKVLHRDVVPSRTELFGVAVFGQNTSTSGHSLYLPHSALKIDREVGAPSEASGDQEGIYFHFAFISQEAG
jgi:hypothetical protein